MWHVQRNSLFYFLAMLAVLVFSNAGEADVFGLFKRIEVQVSPEIKGFITLHGKPQTGMLIKRGIFFGDSWSWDNTRTDADGYFYFAEKLVKARQVLYERQVALHLLAQDYPKQGDEDLFFRMGESYDFKSPTRDLLTAGMHCELSAEYTMSYLKFIENPSGVWRGFDSKCRFLHADKVVVSQSELDAAELVEIWSAIHRQLNYLEQNSSLMDTDDFVHYHMRNTAESSMEMLKRIRELETDSDKLNSIPSFEKKFLYYQNKLNKED